jgi:hypothetical protein
MGPTGSKHSLAIRLELEDRHQICPPAISENSRRRSPSFGEVVGMIKITAGREIDNVLVGEPQAIEEVGTVQARNASIGDGPMSLSP